MELLIIIGLVLLGGALFNWITENDRQERIHQREQAIGLENVDTMDGVTFERYVGKLLINEGYRSIEYTKVTGDYGVDIVASNGDKKYAIQVKRQSSQVSRRAVSDAVAGKDFYSCNASMVITNNRLSKNARQFADSIGCIVIDRDKLGMWISRFQQQQQQVRKQQQQRIQQQHQPQYTDHHSDRQPPSLTNTVFNIKDYTKEELRRAEGLILAEGIMQADEIECAKGVILINDGKFREGLPLFNRAIELNPLNKDAWHNRGVCHLKAGEFALALKDFARAVDICPTYAAAVEAVGAMHLKLGQYNEALPILTRAISLDPNRPMSYYYRGAARSRLGDVNSSTDDFNRAIELDPNNSEFYAIRAMNKYEAGANDEAISDFDSAIFFNYGNAQAHYFRGEIFFKTGRLSDSQVDYKQAVLLNSKYADMPYEAES